MADTPRIGAMEAARLVAMETGTVPPRQYKVTSNHGAGGGRVFCNIYFHGKNLSSFEMTTVETKGYRLSMLRNRGDVSCIISTWCLRLAGAPLRLLKQIKEYLWGESSRG